MDITVSRSKKVIHQFVIESQMPRAVRDLGTTQGQILDLGEITFSYNSPSSNYNSLLIKFDSQTNKFLLKMSSMFFPTENIPGMIKELMDKPHFTIQNRIVKIGSKGNSHIKANLIEETDKYLVTEKIAYPKTTHELKEVKVYEKFFTTSSTYSTPYVSYKGLQVCRKTSRKQFAEALEYMNEIRKVVQKEYDLLMLAKNYPETNEQK